MSIRVGGLLISRKVGEMVTLFYGGPKSTNRKVFHFVEIDKDGAAIFSLEGVKYDLYPDEKIMVGTDSIYLESLEGGRAMIRFLFADSIKIVRSELLGGYGHGGEVSGQGGTIRHYHPISPDEAGKATD